MTPGAGSSRVVFTLGPTGAAAIRFGASASFELLRAVRVLQQPARFPLQGGWLRQVRSAIPTEPLGVIGTLVQPGHYAPDFLTPLPDGPPGADEIRAVSHADLEEMQRDLLKCHSRATGARRTALAVWLGDLHEARQVIARAWAELWTAILAPHWPAVERALLADITARAEQLARVGVAATVESLHERVTWSDDAIVVAHDTWDEAVDCSTTGLLLVPSVFSWPGCSVITEQPRLPTLYYPARGVAHAWPTAFEAQSDALKRLLGTGRAAVLLALDRPLSTREVAASCELADGTASHHTRLLREAGLIWSDRVGKTVRHRRTALGDAVVAGSIGD
ncbi:MAG: DUF5937 family protein [Corynebacteriales bacterium]|nr:DUF5937 family protein [Mycobacteriales bacterium]